MSSELNISEEKKRKIEFLMKKNILISPDLFDKLDGLEISELDQNLENTGSMVVVDKNFKQLADKKQADEINWVELERSKVQLERNKNTRTYNKFVNFLSGKNSDESRAEDNVKVVFSYAEEAQKRDFQDFVGLFNKRYKILESFLRNRQELQNVISINRLKDKQQKDKISLIGLVLDKQETKNGNLMITLEDPTGIMKVVVNKSKPDSFIQAKNLVLDEVIGVSGVNSNNIVFANNLFMPGMPNRELKKAPEPGYALFLSDIHVGSDNFLPKEFGKFISWINLKTGNPKQREIAENAKYIFIIGDLVDGVGIYPDQEKELAIKDIYDQYTECARLLAQIPKHIKIIICPGNHDALRLSEPQPPLNKDYAKPILELPNVISVSNPGIVNIHASEGFPGFDVLMYHGYSFDYYVANVDSIRTQGGYDRADLIMKFLLERRHLAPSHTSTLYVPDTNRDPLVIDRLPDFFATGHIHKSSASNYKNITMISGSCWQAKTKFQEKVGHHPEPARVPIINLQTRELKMLRFEK